MVQNECHGHATFTIGLLWEYVNMKTLNAEEYAALIEDYRVHMGVALQSFGHIHGLGEVDYSGFVDLPCNQNDRAAMILNLAFDVQVEDGGDQSILTEPSVQPAVTQIAPVLKREMASWLAMAACFCLMSAAAYRDTIRLTRETDGVFTTNDHKILAFDEKTFTLPRP